MRSTTQSPGYHLSHLKVCLFEARHKSYDHEVPSFALPVEDFLPTFKALKQNLDISSDRVDVVFSREILCMAQ